MLDPGRLPAENVSGSLRGKSVLVVGINYAPEVTGIAPYTAAFVDAVRGAGASVRVVAGIPHYPLWAVTDAKYLAGTRWDEVVDDVPVTRLAHHVPDGASLAGRLRMEADFLRRALSVVATDRSDLVVCITPSIASAVAVRMARRGRPYGVIVQDLTGRAVVQSGSAGGLVASLVGLVERSTLRRADAVGVITPRFGDAVEALGVPADRVLDVTNFTHVEAVESTVATARERLGWRIDRAAVVHTGNMGRKQGLETVLRASELAQAEDIPVQFYLVGDGNVRAELEESCKTDRVTFVPPVDANTYPHVLAAADVLLLCEKPGVMEMSMPSKLTSYVSAARPIVASVEPQGITADQLRRYGAARLVDAGDHGALLKDLMKVLDEPTSVEDILVGADRMRRELYGKDAAYRRYQEFAQAVAGAARVTALS